MNFRQIEYVRDEIYQHRGLAEYLASHQLCWKGREGWQSDSGKLEDTSVVRDLEESVRTGNPLRRRASGTSHFPLQKIEAVLSISAGRLKQKTIQNLHIDIQTCQENAIQRFRARHDSLTKLLNRDGLQFELERALSSIQPSLSSDSAAAAESPSPRVSWILLDLDNFKQINDSHGHHAGDIALQCFAYRIQNTSQRRLGASHRFEIGRLGGEEFVVAVIGAHSLESATELLEELRHDLTQRPTPDSSEVNALKLAPTPAGPIKLSLGFSAGVHYLGLGEFKNDPARALSTLSERAELAMYRAKQQGRSRTRVFDSILREHGSVIEHHPELNIVAIDLGRQFQNEQGNEFLVFHPHSTGQHPLVKDDGRTRRVLGRYPRRHVARLAVIDVQDEVAFCEVVDCHLKGLIPAGSSLRLVPVGSLDHILSPRSGGLASPISFAKVEDLTMIALESDEGSTIFCVGLTDPAGTQRQYGVAWTNDLLARTCTEFRRRFPSITHTSAIEPTVFAFLSSGPPIEADEIRQAILDMFETTAASQVISAGICRTEPGEFESDPQTRAHLLQRARIALRFAQESDDRAVEFHSDYCWKLIKRRASAGPIEKVRKDIELIRSAGAVDARVENFSALAHYQLEGGSLAEARDHLLNAIKLEPDLLVYRLNLTSVFQRMKEPELAINQLIDCISRPDFHSLTAAQTVFVVGMLAEATGRLTPAQINRTIQLVDTFGEGLEWVPEDRRGRFQDSLSRLKSALGES